MPVIIGRSLTHLNSSRTMGVSVGVPTTRAGKCKLSLRTAALAERNDVIQIFLLD
jgi:hypothetical protein